MNTLIRTLKTVILVAPVLLMLATSARAEGSFTTAYSKAAVREVPARRGASALHTLALVAPGTATVRGSQMARRAVAPATVEAPVKAPVAEMLGFFGKVVEACNGKTSPVRLDGISIVAY